MTDREIRIAETRKIELELKARRLAFEAYRLQQQDGGGEPTGRVAPNRVPDRGHPPRDLETAHMLNRRRLLLSTLAAPLLALLPWRRAPSLNANEVVKPTGWTHYEQRIRWRKDPVRAFVWDENDGLEISLEELVMKRLV